VERVRQAATEKKLNFPIAVDNEREIWRTWGNRFWPCVYLIDKSGSVRYRWVGELNYGGKEGEKLMRAKIEELLAEPGPDKAAKPPSETG
jgi:peroxiredoxin